MYGKTLLTTVAFIAAAGFAGASLAAPAAANPDQVSVAVGIGDLNLGVQPGAAIALRRIHAAARSICGPGPLYRPGRALGVSADREPLVRARQSPARPLAPGSRRASRRLARPDRVAFAGTAC